jgi:Sap, sulfolipid-1-addressing protein
MHEAARIILYGLLATASPVTLLATLVVLGSGRGRANGAAFATAFISGQAIAFLVAFFVGSALSERGHSTASAYLEVAAGAVLLLIAGRARPPYQPRAESLARTDALFERLARLRPGLAFGIGLPLGIGAKRLALTVLAATSVALDDLTSVESAGLTALYIVVSTLVVSIPVTLYVIFGARADELMARTRAWITTNEGLLTFVSALALGVLIILDGTVRLLT